MIHKTTVEEAIIKMLSELQTINSAMYQRKEATNKISVFKDGKEALTVKPVIKRNRYYGQEQEAWSEGGFKLLWHGRSYKKATSLHNAVLENIAKKEAIKARDEHQANIFKAVVEHFKGAMLCRSLLLYEEREALKPPYYDQYNTETHFYIADGRRISATADFRGNVLYFRNIKVTQNFTELTREGMDALITLLKRPTLCGDCKHFADIKSNGSIIGHSCAQEPKGGVEPFYIATRCKHAEAKEA